MCVDANNNIYVTGYFTGSVSIDPTLSDGVLTNSTGGRSVLIAGFSSAGKALAAGAFGSSGLSNLGYEIAAVNGDVYVAGAFSQTVDFDTGSCQIDNFTSINSTSDSFLASFSIASSGPVTSNVITAPAIASFCANGDPAVITASTPSGGNGIYIYQWQSSPDNATFTDIQGATSITYDPPVISATSYYRRIVSNSCAQPDTSNVVNLRVQPALGGNAITAPAVSIFCATGDPAVITGGAATGGNGTYAYQWQSAADGITFTDIPGATSVNYDPPVLNTTTYYRRTVTSAACVTPLISNVLTLSVLPLVANNVITAPAVNSFCSTGDPGVITGSTPTGGNHTYVFQWQSSTDNVTFSNVAGATAKDYDPAVLNTTTYYRRTVTSGACATPLISSPVQIGVIQPLPAPAVNVGVTTTSSVTFQWDAVNGATGYQVSLDNGQNFTDPSSGSNGLTHTVSGLQVQQHVTIIVRAVGSSSCALSSNSTAVTGIAASPLGDQIFVPNAFTPNGDGRNDIVYVHSANIKSLKFYIYDQWGELLYTSLNQANGWDGTYKGNKEPVGVYVYYLEAVMNDGQWVNRKGTITLLR